MITFEIADIEGLFIKLLEPRKKIEGLSELLNMVGLDNSSVETLCTKLGKRAPIYSYYTFGDINLPNPLVKIQGAFYSNRVLYSNITTLSHNCNPDQIKKSFERLTQENDFEKINDTAVICLGNGRYPLFSFYYELNLKFTFGRSGTAIRRLNQFEHFETDMNNFADKLSKVVNAFYEKPKIDLIFPLH